MPIEDADRDRVIGALQRSHASGQIDEKSLKQRVDIALQTDDPYQLNNLLSDLPGGSAYLWTPQPGQQLSPYSPQTGSYGAHVSRTQQRSGGWQEFLRTYWGVILGIGIVLLMVMGNGYFSFWWMFFLLMFVFPRGMRSKMHRPQNRPGPIVPPYQPIPPFQQNQPKAPPRVQDSFDSDDEDGGETGRWNQPPGSSTR